MESRPATLLRLGYNSGRLSFKYPTILSRLREQHILADIEKEVLLGIIKLKAQLEASLLSNIVGRNKAAFDIPFDTLEDYSEIALPYLAKKDKIKAKQLPGIDDLEFWSKFHKESVAEFNKQQIKNTKKSNG